MKNKVILAIGMFVTAAMLMMSLAGCGPDSPSNTSGTSSDTAAVGDYSYVTLGDYKAIEVEVAGPTAVTEEELAAAVEAGILEAMDYTEITDRAVQDGDTVNIDYVGSVDGVEFEGGAAEGTDLVIGSDSFIPGFEEGIIGMQVGEEKDVPVTFPDPYEGNTDLSGAEAVFKITVNSIKVKELPEEITDDFIKEIFDGEYETLAAYEAAKNTELETTADDTYESSKQEAIFAKLLEICTLDKADIPEAEIQAYVDSQRTSYVAYLEQQGQSQTDEEIDSYLREYALQDGGYLLRQVKIKAIAAKESMSITDEEYQVYLEEQAASMGQTAEDFEATYDAAYIRYVMLEEEVLNMIFDSATVVNLD